MKLKVAIQGIGGCNHYIAAKKFFDGEELETIDCNTFKELAKLVADNSDILGIMAIENTIAGSILQNYQLIREYKLTIVGEYKLRIAHALVAMPGIAMEEIREINSHPMALMQCAEFLEHFPDIKLVEKDDTAGSAKWINDNKLKDHAAICPAGAAELYNMNILADGIETNKRNFTRFLIISNKGVSKEVLHYLYKRECRKNGMPEPKESNQWVDKSSIVFTLPHESGSLSKVLSVLSCYDMNLSMIQSIPIIGKEWEYQFHINLLFKDYPRYVQALDAIMPLCSDFEILGEYAEGKQSV